MLLRRALPLLLLTACSSPPPANSPEPTPPLTVPGLNLNPGGAQEQS